MCINFALQGIKPIFVCSNNPGSIITSIFRVPSSVPKRIRPQTQDRHDRTSQRKGEENFALKIKITPNVKMHCTTQPTTVLINQTL